MKEIIEVKMGDKVLYKGYVIYAFEHAVSILLNEKEVAEVKTVGQAIDKIDFLLSEESNKKRLDSSKKFEELNAKKIAELKALGIIQ